MVKTVTLQSLVDQMGGRVDLLKLDIEGAEIAVLKSTPAETLQCIDRIVLDYYIEDAPGEGEGMARENRGAADAAGLRLHDPAPGQPSSMPCGNSDTGYTRPEGRDFDRV